MKTIENETEKSSSFGATINKFRTERNLTQKDLAKMVGVTDRTISKWEKGTTVPDLYQLRNICNELGLSPNLLLKSETVFKDDVNSFKRKLGKVLNYIIHNIFLISFIIVFILLLIYFLGNYNSIKIYSLKYNSDNVYFNHGYMFKTKVTNILTIENINIKKIKYTPTEYKVVLYTLSNGDKKVLYESDTLDNIYIEESVQNQDLLTKDILNNMKRNLHLYITTKDSEDNTYEYDCEISFKEKYVNNKLIYSTYAKDSKTETLDLPVTNLLNESDNELSVASLSNDNIYERLGFSYDKTKDVYTKVDEDGGVFEYSYKVGSLEYTIKDNNYSLLVKCKSNILNFKMIEESDCLTNNFIINVNNNEPKVENKYYEIYKGKIEEILSVYKELTNNVENGE